MIARNVIGINHITRDRPIWVQPIPIWQECPRMYFPLWNCRGFAFFLVHSERWGWPHLCAEFVGNGFFLEFTSCGNFLVKKSGKNMFRKVPILACFFVRILFDSLQFFWPKSSHNWWTQERNHFHPILHTNKVIPKAQSVLEKKLAPALSQWKLHPGAFFPYVW